MAFKTSLRPIARRIAEAVRTAASFQGLAPQDYALVGSYDDETEHLSLTLGTDHPVDDRRWYAEILQEIRRAFPEASQITMHVGLVIRRVQSLEDVYRDAGYSPDETDLTELLAHK